MSGALDVVPQEPPPSVPGLAHWTATKKTRDRTFRRASALVGGGVWKSPSKQHQPSPNVRAFQSGNFIVPFLRGEVAQYSRTRSTLLAMVVEESQHRSTLLDETDIQHSNETQGYGMVWYNHDQLNNIEQQ